MGYKVIFLDGLDGRPFVECEVCKELERNVIEPVALFVEEEDFERIDKQLKNLPQNKIDEVVGKLIKETNKFLGQSEARCIFHCEKENEVWIENIEEYLQYRQRQKDKLMKSKPFNEQSPVKWRKNLVNMFWERIRIYCFILSYFDDENFQEIINEYLEISEFNINIKLIEKLINELYKIHDDKSIGRYFDFRKLIFPIFQKDTFNSNFWYYDTPKVFFGKVNFSDSIFLGDVYLRVIKFGGEIDFSNVKFWENIDFQDSEFSSKGYFTATRFYKISSFKGILFKKFTHFWDVYFYNKIDFSFAKFFGVAYFNKAQFKHEVDFSNVEFKSNAFFKNIQLNSKLIFRNSSFYEKTYVLFRGNSKEVDFSSLQCHPDTHIEIRNLKTKYLVMSDITNYAKEFLFFDLELLPSEKSDEPNLEIKNSILNKMRFINCDFSKGEKIKIEDSSIASCEFVNVKWGKITEKRICPELFDNEPSKAQDIYRQLKLAHDNQKDFIHGGDFYALEMRAYDKYLDSLSWLEHFKDKIVFKISKFASNYAQDWWLVLKWIYSIVIAMTVLVYIDSSRITFGNNYLEILLFTILLAVNLVIFSKKARWWFKFLFLICYFFFLNFLVYSNFDIRLFFDDFFITLGRSLYPIKTVLNGDKNHQHIPLYKTFFGLGWVALSYLIYQLVVSLRRKIRR